MLQALTSGTPTAIYDRFIDAVKRIKPTAIITTNPDELLEQRIAAHVVMPSDFEIVPQLLADKKPFIAKLHGSVSQIESLVFTDAEYAKLLSEKPLINALTRVFEISTVVFIGYGLRDDYVLKRLSAASDLARLFGTGPHFACRSTVDVSLPASIRTIKYIAEPHRDHRSVIQVIEEVAVHLAKTDVDTRNFPEPSSTGTSLHMLSDVYPVGTWSSSQRIVAQPPDGADEIVFYVGHGLNEAEMPLTVSTAMHDLAVGLICFDRVLSPLSALGRVHHMLGSRLEQLLRADVLRFVRLRRTEMVLFHPGTSDIIGSLGTVDLPENADRGGGEVSIREVLMRQVKPIPGKQREVEPLFELLERQLLDPTPSDGISIAEAVRGLLLRPSVREMLGMSGGVPVTAVPRWMMFPVLRLAQVVRLGMVCQSLGVDSIKFEFGNDRLAGVSFGSSFGNEFAARLASYVVTGSFSTDLGGYINENPGIIDAILRFRDSPAGHALRTEIRDSLAKGDGAEVVASINGGLRQVVPLSVLEAARANFAQLAFVKEEAKYPAIWYDAQYGTKALKLWRNKAADDLKAICSNAGLGDYDQCPCGSGEKLRFCCGEALAK